MLLHYRVMMLDRNLSQQHDDISMNDQERLPVRKMEFKISIASKSSSTARRKTCSNPSKSFRLTWLRHNNTI